MKYLLLLLLFPAIVKAQLEDVIIETYYVSDANDATDTTGGALEAGTKTYRIYIDLVAGSKLKKIYGDANHAFKIFSTAVFFNNKEDGQTFAKDFSKTRYGDNTVALDTWLTLGQTTKTAAKTYFGVPKVNDRDGSFIGGTNNDGGSASVSTGLLTNDDASAGVPLTTSDGMDTMSVIPGNWANFGILDAGSSEDSSIFGSLKTGKEFISNNMAIQNSGVTGVIAAYNQILVAQLTTRGELTFELNIEVEDTNGNSIKYVANADTLLPDETGSLKLKYPPACGCDNPDYLEYSAGYACGVADSCRTLIVFGCTDSMACNYDRYANFSIPSMCCYPGACNDLDISLVCRTLGIDDTNPAELFNLYPNPATNRLTLELSEVNGNNTGYAIFDFLGREVLRDKVFSNGSREQIDISALTAGAYTFRLYTGATCSNKLFIKE